MFFIEKTIEMGRKIVEKSDGADEDGQNQNAPLAPISSPNKELDDEFLLDISSITLEDYKKTNSKWVGSFSSLYFMFDDCTFPRFFSFLNIFLLFNNFTLN